MTTIKEVKVLNSDDVRALCIRKQWYELGTNEEYSQMLEFADSEEVTPTLIYKIAGNIFYNTDSDRFKDYNQTDKENIQSIMYEIGCLVDTFYEVVA